MQGKAESRSRRQKAEGRKKAERTEGGSSLFGVCGLRRGFGDSVSSEVGIFLACTGQDFSQRPAGFVFGLTMGVTYTIMKAKKYSTLEVADLVKVSPNTIYRWIQAKKFSVPPVVFVGKVRIRLWTEKEVEAVRKYKASFYNKGRGHGDKVVQGTKRK